MSPEPRAVVTAEAPAPAGTYSQAIEAGGLVFLAGQTPRRPSGERLNDAPFETQVRQALTNLATVAEAAGSSLARAVKVTVYLRDPAQSGTFDAIYRTFVGAPAPVRTLVQSDLPGFAVEVDAILLAGTA